MSKNATPVLIAALLTLATALPVNAETTDENAFKYRSAVMKTLGGHVFAASLTVRGLVEDKGFLSHHAQGLANGAAELEYLFQQGSNVGESEALPIIWEETGEFAEAIAAAEAATDEFVEAVASEDPETIGAAFKEVGNACRGCHDKFRVEQ